MRFFGLCCEQKDRAGVMAFMVREGFALRELAQHSTVMAAMDDPVPLGSSLAHYFGFIYVQDLSSVLPVMLLNPPAGSMILDMCASPGGKTSQLAMAAGPKGLVLGNEPNRSRLATLRANIRRLNLMNVATAGYNGSDLGLEGLSFDCILLDVPCSGWGTVNKNPAAIRMWTRDKTSSLVSLQKTLIETAAGLLTPGGKLVYSTCTTNEAENEDQIRWAQDNTRLKCVEPEGFTPFTPDFPDIESVGTGMMRVHGSRAAGQDFFMSLMTIDGQEPGRDKFRPARRIKKPQAEPVDFSADMRQPESGALWNFSGNVFFVPDRAWDLLEAGLLVQGIHVGRKKDRRMMLFPRMRAFLPEHGAKEGFVTSSIQEVRALISGQSLQYSGRESFVSFYWQDLGLGWLKSRNSRLFWSER